MKYAMLIHERPGYVDAMAGDEQKAVLAEYAALAQHPLALGNARLQPAQTATMVRVEDGRTLITDGPFADTKEVFGGFIMFEADNLDEAIELAARIPAARFGGVIEVRPLAEH